MSDEGSPGNRSGAAPLGRRAVLQLAATGALGSTAATGSVAAQPSGDVEWRFDVDGGVYSSPTVVDGTTYVTSGPYAYAIDADSGYEQWRSTELGEEFHASPTVVDDAAFVAVDGSVYALDAATGEVAWEADLGVRSRASPVVADGTLYVALQAGERVNAKSFTVYALDAATGEEQWQHEISDVGGSTLSASPVVVDGTVYAVDNHRHLLTLDADTGEGEWRTEVGNATSSPTVAEGVGRDTGEYTVFVGTASGVTAVDAATGDVRWQYDELDDAVRTTPTVATVDGGIGGPTVFVGCEDEFVYAFDAVSGEREWRYPVGSPVHSSPTITGDDTVFVGARGVVYSLDAATGDLDAKFDDGLSVRHSSPTVVDGRLYVGGTRETVHALDVGAFATGEGSRARLGTLGHHGTWKHGGQSIDLQSATSEDDGDGGDDGDEGDGGESGEDADGSEGGDGGDADDAADDGNGTETPDETAEAAPADDATDGEDAAEDENATDGEDAAEDENATDDQNADGLPGFGVTATLTGLGAGYLLSKRRDDDVEETRVGGRL